LHFNLRSFQSEIKAPKTGDYFMLVYLQQWLAADAGFAEMYLRTKKTKMGHLLEEL
jgi:hypothetical protein